MAMREIKEYQVKVREQIRNEQMLSSRSASTARLQETTPISAILTQ